MGLCKCPKRRVTNQFCFEHRVNVCEHCIVSNHTKCIVQSYIQWLQDSDYNPVCELCEDPLADKDCIRLTCYHVFHWSCLESTFRKFPRTTAPAGYKCPTCRFSLFPPPNLVSPVADVLRERLAGANWARAGLGLSLLNDDITASHHSDVSSENMDSHYGPSGYAHNGSTSRNDSMDGLGMSSPHRITPIGASDDEGSNRKANGPPYSVIQVQDDAAYEPSTYGQAPRKIFEAAADPGRHTNRFDHDEDKYKRKSATEWMVRWWKNSLPPARNRRTTGGFNRRTFMLIVILVIVVVSLITVLMRIGRASIENDPNFNVINNPNIHFDAEA